MVTVEQVLQLQQLQRWLNIMKPLQLPQQNITKLPLLNITRRLHQLSLSTMKHQLSTMKHQLSTPRQLPNTMKQHPSTPQQPLNTMIRHRKAKKNAQSCRILPSRMHASIGSRNSINVIVSSTTSARLHRQKHTLKVALRVSMLRVSMLRAVNMAMLPTKANATS